MAKKESKNRNHEIASNGYGSVVIEPELTKETLAYVFRKMYLARQTDLRALSLLKQGKTFFHIAGSGHEAIQTAISMQLDPKKDWLHPYYRDLALSFTAGITPYDFFLQSFGKLDDPASGGRMMPGHYGSTELNIPCQSSPTGTQFLQAVGTALATHRQKSDAVSYVSSGEGTTSQGEFHEAVNWAAREKLPVIFCIQNNGYAISVPVAKQSGGLDNSISEMMKGYHNLKRIRVDGTDFFKSYEAAKEAINYARGHKGPVLIEADVVRLLSHSSSDDQKKYRALEEIEDDLKKDPIEKFIKNVVEQGIFTQEEINEIKKDADAEIADSVERASKAADPKPEDSTHFVFDESGLKDTFTYYDNEGEGTSIVMVDAINHALHEEMERNEKTFLFGEDVADKKGGVFTATKGLTQKFGEERVFNSPLAEASIAGVAAGLALAGMKPVVEIQFGDYIYPAFMQIKNEIATFRYRTNNAWPAPVVIRVAVGGYIHGGLYHSQNIESIFAHIPGLYIAYPSNSADAKGLLKTAIRLNDPVLFCEHKGLYRQSFAMAPEPGKDYLVPFGQAKVVREGSDLSVITYGAEVWETMFAAKKLEEEGYSVEIIDLRTIIPLDVETIYNSVKKTNKAIVIHEDTLTQGFGAEIAARIGENCFEHLDGPVRRVAAKDTHIPYAPVLENDVLPTRSSIYNQLKTLLEY